MLVLRDRLINVPLMSLQTGTQVGMSAEPIIDPRKLNIIAFYCQGSAIDFSPAVLHVSDIRELSSLGMIVDSADNIMPPDDLVRLQEVLNFHFTLEGKPVVDVNRRKLGKVVNYTVDVGTFYIAKLHVKPSLLQSFNSAELLIDRSQIKSVTDKEIIVKQATVKAERPAKAQAKPVIDNPFRKVKPQHQAAERQE